MESQLSKIGIGFAVLMLAGFIIVGTTRETPQEKIQGAFLQTSNLLGNLAFDKCSDAVKQEVGAHPYTPSESESDHTTFVRLVWNNVGSVNRAECRYVMNQGITLLKIDDRAVIEKTAVTGSAPAAPKAAHH